MELPVRSQADRFTTPGRYRMVVTLHGRDGVALDAETQALVPALLVRVAGPIDVTYSAPATAKAQAGGTLQVLVRVANSGTVEWTTQPAAQVRSPGVSATAAVRCSATGTGASA